jgi:hypothetical protein
MNSAQQSLPALPILGAAILGYLLLLGRSAWKQGELRQFAVSLAILAALLAALAAIAALTIALQSR